MNPPPSAVAKRNGPALQATGLVVRLGGRTVLEVPSLAVERGEVLAIIGPNGSGKSTLLQALALLAPLTSGKLCFEGESVHRGSDLVALRRRMAVVFQEPLLLNMSLRENVTLGLRLRGLPQSQVACRADFWLQRFGIDSLATRHARALSGGEAQRASLARAFALEPEVLFLDEPFAALDAPTRAELIESLVAVLRETGVTTVFVTHDRNEALALGGVRCAGGSGSGGLRGHGDRVARAGLSPRGEPGAGAGIRGQGGGGLRPAAGPGGAGLPAAGGCNPPCASKRWLKLQRPQPPAGPGEPATPSRSPGGRYSGVWVSPGGHRHPTLRPGHGAIPRAAGRRHL